jgi:hypothetical protein
MKLPVGTPETVTLGGKLSSTADGTAKLPVLGAIQRKRAPTPLVAPVVDAPSINTKPFELPPVQLTVNPADRVMVEVEFVHVRAGGRVIVVVNAPTFVPPEPVIV